MRAMINRVDNVVVVDGVAMAVDCSSLPGYVKVIQWQDDRGHIEFVQDHRSKFLPNLPIIDFSPYTYLVEAWTEAKRLQDEERAKRAAEKAERARGNPAPA